MDRADMRRMYADGATMRQVAAAAGCGLTKVHRNLADVACLPGGPRRTVDPSVAATVRQLVADGASQNEAARQLHLSRRQVADAMHAHQGDTPCAP